MIIDNSIFDISKELFPSSSPDFSQLEENSNINDDPMDIYYLINPLEKLEKMAKEEIIFNQELNNNEINKKEVTINIKENIITNNNKYNLSTTDSKEKNFEKKEIKDFLKSVRNLQNIIIRDLGYKKNVSLGKLNYFLRNNSLDEIKHKTLKEIFEAISPKNIYIINFFSEIERKEGKTIFNELNKLTFEEMYDYYLQDCKCIISGIHIYNLTKKFKTLKDFSEKKNKKLKKKLTKKRKRKRKDKAKKNLDEIKQEVCAIIID